MKRILKCTFVQADIDECVDEDICGNFGECSNQAGNYTCICNQGYELIGRNLCTGLVIIADLCIVFSLNLLLCYYEANTVFFLS